MIDEEVRQVVFQVNSGGPRLEKENRAETGTDHESNTGIKKRL